MDNSAYDVQGLLTTLRGELRGTAADDRRTRALYAADGSNYRAVPDLVVVPADVDDLAAAVSLTAALPQARLVLGEADAIDPDARTVSYVDPEGERGEVGYDRLILAAGSVNKLLPIPGVAEHAHGFRGIPEALYLRDHIIRQMELADAADDPDERAARWAAATMELGALVCTAKNEDCTRCPIATQCAWRLAGKPEHQGPPRRGQTYAGTDRQVRGRLLAVLREAVAPVPQSALDAVWEEPAQRARALDGLVADGLVEPLPGGHYQLPLG